MSDYKNHLLKRLKFEVKQLRDELVEIKPIFEKACGLFFSNVGAYCDKHKLRNPLEDLCAPEKEEKELPDPFKVIFRKIAVQTHPDKVQSDDMREPYEGATKAKKESDVFELFGIASDLKIDTSDLTFDEIDALRHSIKEKREELGNIYNHMVFKWYYANNNAKDKFITAFVKCNVEE